MHGAGRGQCSRPALFETERGDYKLVVFDTSYLTTMFNFVRNAIGNAVNIGIVIFGVIVAIYIVVSIVRKFTKG